MRLYPTIPRRISPHLCIYSIINHSLIPSFIPWLAGVCFLLLLYSERQSQLPCIAYLASHRFASRLCPEVALSLGPLVLLHPKYRDRGDIRSRDEIRLYRFAYSLLFSCRVKSNQANDLEEFGTSQSCLPVHRVQDIPVSDHTRCPHSTTLTHSPLRPPAPRLPHPQTRHFFRPYPRHLSLSLTLGWSHARSTPLTLPRIHETRRRGDEPIQHNKQAASLNTHNA